MLRTTNKEKSELNELTKRKQKLRTRVIFCAVAGVLTFASLVYLGVAWYTRITSTHAVTFDVADYELAMDDNTENEFLVNVYDYSNVKEKTMAPGTAGYIPIRLSGRHSDIEVDYSILFQNKMVEDMQKRIRFFYLRHKSAVGKERPVVLSLEYKEGVPTIVESDRWLFMKSPDTLPSSYIEKVYFPVADPTVGGTNLEDFTINGTLTLKDEGTGTADKMIYIYWEWYLDAEDAAAKDAEIAKVKQESTAEEWAEYCEAWNAFDTDMGRYPKKYFDAMFVHLTCSGVQSTPELEPREP